MKKRDLLRLIKNIPEDSDMVFNIQRILKSQLTKEVSGYRVSLNLIHYDGTIENDVMSMDINLSFSERKDPSKYVLDILSRP